MIDKLLEESETFRNLYEEFDSMISVVDEKDGSIHISFGVGTYFFPEKMNVPEEFTGDEEVYPARYKESFIMIWSYFANEVMIPNEEAQKEIFRHWPLIELEDIAEQKRKVQTWLFSHIMNIEWIETNNPTTTEAKREFLPHWKEYQHTGIETESFKEALTEFLTITGL